MNTAHQLLALTTQTLPPIGTGPGFGKIINDTTLRCGSGPLIAVARIVSTLIGVLTLTAGLFFLFQFLLGGAAWISASGDKNKLTAAQQRLTQALLGLVVVVGSYGVVAVVGSILGIDILLNNPAAIIQVLTGGGPSC